MSFKVGDRVKIIGKDYSESNEFGIIIRKSETYGENIWVIRLKTRPEYSVYERHLKLSPIIDWKKRLNR